jgi:hypothetical protein
MVNESFSHACLARSAALRTSRTRLKPSPSDIADQEDVADRVDIADREDVTDRADVADLTYACYRCGPT